MTSTLQNKVPKRAGRKLSAAEIARRLNGTPDEVSERQVRKDIANGADATDEHTFVESKKANEQRASRKSSGNASLAKLREQKLRKEIQLLHEKHVAEKRENQVRSGVLVERSKVREDLDKAVSKAVAVLVQKFENELPPKQDGMPAAKIAEMNRAAIQQVRLILSQPEAYAR